MEEFFVFPTSIKGSVSHFVSDNKGTRDRFQVSQPPLLSSSSGAAVLWLREKPECRPNMQNSCMAVREDILETEQCLIPITAAL